MFALVKYQDGVKKVVPSSDIKHFDPKRISYSKKYKIKWENEEYYDGVIIVVGDTETEIDQKASQKRQKIMLYELSESADDTDSSIARNVEDKNNNEPQDYIQQIVARKVEKIQMNLDKFVKGRETGETKTKKKSRPLSSDLTLPKNKENKNNEPTKVVKATNTPPAVSETKNTDSKKAKTKVACEQVQKCSISPAVHEKNNNRVIEDGNRKPENEKASTAKKIAGIPVQKRANIKDHIGVKKIAPPPLVKKMDSKKPPISVTIVTTQYK